MKEKLIATFKEKFGDGGRTGWTRAPKHRYGYPPAD